MPAASRSDEMPEATLVLKFDACTGPLFHLSASSSPILCGEVPSACPPSSPSAFIQRVAPQMIKKAFRDVRLSIEEVTYLQHLSSSCAERHPFRVVLDGTDVLARYETLSRCYHHDCLMYRYLTDDHHYALRHGSQFGALFIGYQVRPRKGSEKAVDAASGPPLQHGEVLFFPAGSRPSSPAIPVSNLLPPLDVSRAMRISRTVSKTAMGCCLIDDNAVVVWRFIAPDEDDNGVTTGVCSASPLRKRGRSSKPLHQE